MSGSEGAGSRQRGPATRHIAMRLQHLKQIAGALSEDDPARVAAKAVIVEEVERLHWRIWNGKAKDAQVSIDRIRAVMHHFRGEPDQRRSSAPSRKLWTALRALDGDLTGQSALAGQLRRAAPCGLAGGHRDHRSHGQRPGEPPDEQVTADALVATRRRPAAAGSVRRLQWHARFRLRTEIPPSQRSMPANGDRRLTPNLAAVPCNKVNLAVNVPEFLHLEPLSLSRRSSVSCFPGPREWWGWRGKTGFAGTRLHGAGALAQAEEAGRKPVWGREGATPLGPPLRRVCGDQVLTFSLSGIPAFSTARRIVTRKGRDAALRLGKGPRAPLRAWSERTRPPCSDERPAGVLASPSAKGAASRARSLTRRRPGVYLDKEMSLEIPTGAAENVDDSQKGGYPNDLA